jgi:hypothetical protein
MQRVIAGAHVGIDAEARLHHRCWPAAASVAIERLRRGR